MENKLFEELVAFRRQLHENPELGFKELATTAAVMNKLIKLDIPFEKITETGLIGTLEKGNGPVVVLRADMDALPLQEQTGLSFESRNKGVMHACGHDLHTTMLVGAASLLKYADFEGTIKFVFQPSEEGTDNSPQKGKSGGQIVMESGKLSGASAALGLHVHPLMPVGMIGHKNGLALANVANFRINIAAAGGHAGSKQAQLNSVEIVGQLVNALNGLLSSLEHRQGVTIVFTYAGTEGAPNFNILPPAAFLQGTLRAIDADDFHTLKEAFETLVKHTAQELNADIVIEFTAFYPALVNSDQVHEYLLPAHQRVFGKGKILPFEPQLIGEDFAFYAQEIPSQMYFIGAKDPVNDTYFLHNPRVTFSEECIRYGATFFAEGAKELLLKYRK